MKIKLIEPKRSHSIYEHSLASTKEGSEKVLIYHSIAPSLIAALTPSDYDISIIDENLEPIDFNEKVDLVGISFSSSALARQGYSISKEFRSRGAKVILGGIHPSSLPDEAINHADSIVIGEAEPVWQEVLEDAKKGSLKRIYRAKPHYDLTDLPIPRKDLLKTDRYIVDSIITSRGCPHNCSFCAAKLIHGQDCRLRPIDNVIKEIKESKFKNFYFFDDNILYDRERAYKLLKGLIPLNIRWQSNAPIYIVKDDAFLKLASKSGCDFLSIGFESLNQENLSDLKKIHNKGIKYDD